MKKKFVLFSMLLLLSFTLLLSTGCKKAKDMLSEAEEKLTEAEKMMDDASKELEDVSEKIKEETEKLDLDEAAQKLEEVVSEVTGDHEYSVLQGATFLMGGMGVYISEVQIFTENEKMNLPYQENKGYLYIKGTIDNNLDEAKTLGQVLNLSGYDESGRQIGNASSWIESDGIFNKVEPSEQIEFDDLYMYDTTNSYILIEFDERNVDNKMIFKVNIEDVSAQSMESNQENQEEMLNILSTMSYDIIAAIDQDLFEQVAQYSQYTFISPSLNRDAMESVYFESYNWEQCLSDEEVKIWGEDYEGNIVEMTCNDFFNVYISEYNFLANAPEIKQEKVKYFTDLSDYQATHYVKYTSGVHVMYLIYEETYFNEFILTGIGIGVE